MEFSTPAKEEIAKLYKGRHHVELSVGILKDGVKNTYHFGLRYSQKRFIKI